MIKISIIIPIYNNEKYLKKCIDSVLEQNMREIEVICVNDGSTDRSLEILKEMQILDERVKIFDKENSGAAKSRNFAMQEAKGEYLFFLDSDDWIATEDALELLYCFAKTNSLEVCGGSLCIYESGHYNTNFCENQKKYVFEKDEIILYKDYQFDLGFSRFIYKREMLLKNNIFFPEYRNYEDPVFCVKALNTAGEIGVFKKSVYVYRKNIEGMSRSVKLDSIIDMVNGMKDNLFFAEKNELYDLYRATYRRLNKEALCEIENCLNYEDKDHKLFKLLIQVDAMINREILGNTENDMLEALNMVYQEYKKYERIRNYKIVKIMRKIKGKR